MRSEMRAVICPKGGPPQVLQLVEIEKPLPSENEVLIKVHATTVTAGDAVLRGLRGPLRFIFGLVFDLGKNTILGHELAGEIEAVGSRVTKYQVGDAVFASTGNKGGANAEYICLPEDSMLAQKPGNLTFIQAAAVPIGANTALYILKDTGIQPGKRVLVYGASGSVGTYAIQLAKHFGAIVTGVCSSANLELVKSLGADEVIDYTTEDFTHRRETYDVIFDAVMKISASDCKDSLKKDGVFLSASASTEEKIENLLLLKELLEIGSLRPVIDRVYSLEEIVEAHRYVDTGRKKGNVVIKIFD